MKGYHKPREELFASAKAKALIEDYKTVTFLGKTKPTKSDIKRYGSYSFNEYVETFGSWSYFLNIYRLFSPPLEEDILRVHFIIKHILGSDPKQKDILRYSTILHKNFRKHWARGWKGFKKFINSPENVELIHKIDYESSEILKQAALKGDHEINLGAFKVYHKPLYRYSNITNNKTDELKKNLIAKFIKLEKEIKRIPTISDFEANGNFKYNDVTKAFGGWKLFLNALGKVIETGYIPPKELDKNYDKVKGILRRIPSIKEMNRLGDYSSSTYINRYGTWRNYLLYRGDKIKHFSEATDEEIISNYDFVKQRLNKIPTLGEMKESSNYGYSSYYKRFGGYESFLLSRGEKTFKEKMVEEYFRVKKLSGKKPAAHEFSKLANVSWSSAAKYFGSWNNFLIAVGETPRMTGRRLPKNQEKKFLIDAYNKVSKDLGRVPKALEFTKMSGTSHQTASNYFGSWKKFILVVNRENSQLKSL